MVTGLSDHNLTLIARKLTKQRFNTPINKKPYRVGISKGNITEFENAIEGINWSDCLEGTDVEEKRQSVISAIQSVIHRFQKVIKTKHSQKRVLPWIKGDIWKLMKERDSALKTTNKSKINADRHTFVMLRNKVTKQIRKAKAKYFIDVINEAKGNTTAIWKRLKTLTN